jgi:hypothetical protein
MTREQHMARHRTLHGMLDELLADYLRHGDHTRSISDPIADLMRWSFEQTQARSLEHDLVDEQA